MTVFVIINIDIFFIIKNRGCHSTVGMASAECITFSLVLGHYNRCANSNYILLW